MLRKLRDTALKAVEFVGDKYVEGHEKEVNARKSIVRDLLEREGLSCKECSGLGIPIYSTENKYRCVKCDHQFASTNHNIRTLILQHFEGRPRNRHKNESSAVAIYSSVASSMSKG